MHGMDETRWYNQASGRADQDYTIDASLIPVGRGLKLGMGWIGKWLWKGTGKAAKGGINVLSKGELLRIKNAAIRINKPINVVGSRAAGKAGAYSDWDYVIEGINRRSWNKIKNSLPGARSVLDNTPKKIDLFRGSLNSQKPHITIYPN